MPYSVKTATIKTFNGQHKAGTDTFFILSKGNNAGKPLQKPCPNCFVVTCEDHTERELLFWLCFVLWQAGTFRPFLCGSVIPFIRVRELKEVITQHREDMAGREAEFSTLIKTFSTIASYLDNISAQVQKFKEVRRALVYKFFVAKVSGIDAEKISNFVS
jgi:hypothetical protein